MGARRFTPKALGAESAVATVGRQATTRNGGIHPSDSVSGVPSPLFLQKEANFCSVQYNSKAVESLSNGPRSETHFLKFASSD